MAEMKLAISGDADAVGELLTYKPVQVLQRAGLVPGDLKGKITADVEARLGLLRSQDPPPPEWKATMQLSGVDVGKPVSGRMITSLNGALDADPQQVALDAEGQIDGVPAEIELVEPTDKSSGVKPQRIITATLNNAQRAKVLPGLSGIIDGSLTMQLTKIDEERQNVQIDLDKASLQLPWIGWAKGSGIGATAEFEVSGPPEKTQIRSFRLKGDGFGASGSFALSKGDLESADFDSVRLSSLDDFAISIRRNRGNFDVSVSGNTADARPILARLKNGQGDSDGDGGGSASVSVRANLTASLASTMKRSAISRPDTYRAAAAAGAELFRHHRQRRGGRQPDKGRPCLEHHERRCRCRLALRRSLSAYAGRAAQHVDQARQRRQLGWLGRYTPLRHRQRTAPALDRFNAGR
ncbi:hypothetical protein AJ87_20580 [Rhizobium yanglingense]|nr:hypothetical protein AJ87_20580 [Rhizobium yanglingense]